MESNIWDLFLYVMYVPGFDGICTQFISLHFLLLRYVPCLTVFLSITARILPKHPFQGRLGQSAHYCGSFLPPAFTSIGRTLSVNFVADESGSAKGFSARYRIACKYPESRNFRSKMKYLVNRRDALLVEFLLQLDNFGHIFCSTQKLSHFVRGLNW